MPPWRMVTQSAPSSKFIGTHSLSAGQLCCCEHNMQVVQQYAKMPPTSMLQNRGRLSARRPPPVQNRQRPVCLRQIFRFQGWHVEELARPCAGEGMRRDNAVAASGDEEHTADIQQAELRAAATGATDKRYAAAHAATLNARRSERYSVQQHDEGERRRSPGRTSSAAAQTPATPASQRARQVSRVRLRALRPSERQFPPVPPTYSCAASSARFPCGMKPAKVRKG